MQMNRRDFIKTTGFTAAMGGLAGCNSIIYEYYEPNLSELSKFEIDYERLQESKIKLLSKHSQLIDRLGSKVTFSVDSNNYSQEITYRRDPDSINHSVVQKVTNSDSTPKEVLNMYSTTSTIFYQIQTENEEVEYSTESTDNVYLYSGRSTLLNWLDSMDIEHSDTKEMNGTELHKYNISSFNDEQVVDSILSVNDRGVILEFKIRTEEYNGHFEASNFGSISFEQPVWISNA